MLLWSALYLCQFIRYWLQNYPFTLLLLSLSDQRPALVGFYKAVCFIAHNLLTDLSWLCFKCCDTDDCMRRHGPLHVNCSNVWAGPIFYLFILPVCNSFNQAYPRSDPIAARGRFSRPSASGKWNMKIFLLISRDSWGPTFELTLNRQH